VTTQTPQSANRLERILAYMVAGVVGISIIAFIAVIIGTSTGVGANDGFSQGIWPFVIMLPLFGLPIGFVLIIVLMVTNAVRRGSEARRNRQ
jgi:hypothetical protein